MDKVNKKKVFCLSKIIKNYKQNKIMFKKAKTFKIHKPADDVALSIQHLTMIFKIGFQKYKLGVDDISFEIKKGQFHGFIGDNGAGKTTTIRSILGFYPSVFGKIYIDKYCSKDKNAKKMLGYIPETALFPKQLTVREYLQACAEMSGLTKEQSKQKIELLLEKYNFNVPELNKSPAQMSSGQKKTVLLMQALLNDPDILILDEPAANLDPTARIRFYEQISKLHKEGKTILISSHIIDELEQYIDSYTVLSQGKVLHSGLISDLKEEGFYNIKIQVDDTNKFETLLSKAKIEFEASLNGTNCRITNINDQKIILNLINKNNLNLLNYEVNKKDLKEKYFNKKPY